MKIRDLFAAEDRSAIEKYCRAQTQQAYLGDHTAIARVLGQFLMYVDTRDLSLAPHLLMNGFWEMWVTQAIVDYVKPGMRCFDIGANFGYFTLLLSELVGDKGGVDAYEPQVGVRESLMKSIDVNGFKPRVDTYFCAASDETGYSKLYVQSTQLGSAALTQSGGLHDQGGVVATSRLDDQHSGPVDFVKIDVQGHELRVLDGMKKMIERSPRIAIAMEFTPGEHESPRAQLEKISSYGLTIKTIGTDGQVRAVTLEDAAKADTGDHRMLWLQKG